MKKLLLIAITLTGFAKNFDDTYLDLPDVVEKSLPAVVWIMAERATGWFEWFLTGEEYVLATRGSGFFVSEDGHLLTNYHVISGCDRFMVELQDGTFRRYEATLIGTDRESDIAVLKVNEKGPFSYLPFGDSSSVRMGDWVFALGFPFGLEATATFGVVSNISQKGLDYESFRHSEYIQTDALINPGNSGGPLLNLRGEVVGVNNWIYGCRGIGFSITSAVASKVCAMILKDGKVTLPESGLYAKTVTWDQDEPYSYGVKILRIDGDSPAKRAGLMKGDIILACNGKLVKTLAALNTHLFVNDSLTLTVHRDGELFEVELQNFKPNL